MAISFGCHHCGKRLKAPESAAGKTSKCPRCHKPVTCPRPSTPAPPIDDPDVPEILDDMDPYGDVAESNPYAAPKARDEELELPRRPAPTGGEKKRAKKKKQKGKYSGHAGFWPRFAGAFVDGLLLAAVIVPLAVMWAMPSINALDPELAHRLSRQARKEQLASMMAPMRIVVQLLVAVYFVGMESSPYQATLGKLMLGVRVTDLQGYRISIPRAIVRYLIKQFLSPICLIGYLMFFFTEKKQTLHDKIAGTMVVE